MKKAHKSAWKEPVVYIVAACWLAVLVLAAHGGANVLIAIAFANVAGAIVFVIASGINLTRM